MMFLKTWKSTSKSTVIRICVGFSDERPLNKFGEVAQLQEAAKQDFGLVGFEVYDSNIVGNQIQFDVPADLVLPAGYHADPRLALAS